MIWPNDILAAGRVGSVDRIAAAVAYARTEHAHRAATLGDTLDARHVGHLARLLHCQAYEHPGIRPCVTCRMEALELVTRPERWSTALARAIAADEADDLRNRGWVS